MDRLYGEVETVLEGRRMVTAADLDRLQYVKCVIKEALRSGITLSFNGYCLRQFRFR